MRRKRVSASKRVEKRGGSLTSFERALILSFQSERNLSGDGRFAVGEDKDVALHNLLRRPVA